MVVEQGEGPRGHWRDAHYGRFLEVLGEYLTMTRADRSFEPARPVVACHVRRPVDTDPEVLVTDPTTARVLDAFNVAYEIMLQTIACFFGHDDDEGSHGALANLLVGLMVQVIKPLGELVTRLPVGPERPGKTAGPSFELFYASGYLLPDTRAAWVLLHERLMELQAFLNRPDPEPEVQDVTATAATAVGRMAEGLTTTVTALAERNVIPPRAWR